MAEIKNTKDKKWFYIIGGIVLLFIVAGVYFYYQGAKKVTLQSKPGELPGNPDAGNVSGASNDEIKKLASDLYTEMKGFNLFGHDYTPYKDANALNDADLIKLYNTFNTIYQKDSGQTLIGWLNSESFRNSDYPDLLKTRFAKLNCI